MLKYRLFLVVFLLAFITFTGTSLFSQDQLRIAIMDFQNLSNISDLDYLEKAIPEILITGLSLSKKIKIVERTRLEEILKEMQLTLSGAVDQERIVEVGKIAGAKAILLGSIIKAGETFRIDSRLIDASTGEVILAEKKEWSSESEVIAAVDLLAEQIIKSLTGESIQISEKEPTEGIEFPEGRSVAMETALNNNNRLIGSDEPVYLQIELFSQEIEDKERIPLNISLVIDRSGSMASERKLDYVKKAAEFVVNNLGVDDILSLVTYESSIQTPIKAQNANRREFFLQTIRSITSGGSTNLSGGMLEGYTQTHKNRRTGQVNRVLLLSDGLANRGITDPRILQDICRERVSRGISISIFGVGANYNEDLMLGLAEYGSGNYYFIDTPEKIPAIFSQELKGLLAVTAQNVKLEIEPNSDVVIQEVYGYISESSGNLTRITIGDIFSNEHRIIILKLIPPKDYSGSLQLARVTLTYDDVIGKKEKIEESSAPSVDYTNDKNKVKENENRYVGQNVNLFTSTVQMQAAINMVDRGEIDKAREVLSKEVSSVKLAAEKYQTVELKKQILAIHRYDKSLEKYIEKPAAERKLIQKKEKYGQYKTQKRKEVEEKFPQPKPQIIDKQQKPDYNRQDIKKSEPSIRKERKSKQKETEIIRPQKTTSKKSSKSTSPVVDKKKSKPVVKEKVKSVEKKVEMLPSKKSVEKKESRPVIREKIEKIETKGESKKQNERD
ncbi:MAG: VWA domain-containing protein [Candidatus Marinimicrobia bacterium]|nr:VWA domain-containing protein [Candidatus Neomarinimicrobiota bacterium]